MNTPIPPTDPPAAPGSSSAAPTGLAAADAGAAELFVAGIDAPATDTPIRMKKSYLTALLIGYGALYVAWIAPSAFSLAVRIQQIDPAGKDTALAVAIGLPGIIVLLTGPLGGVLSDQTKSRFGRRRPWLLAGTLLGFLGSVGLAVADSVPMIIAAWTVAFVGYTTVGGMFLTHLSDRLPAEQRGRVAGVSGSVTQITPIIGILLAGTLVAVPAAMFLVPAAIGLIGGIIFIAVMKDPAPTTAAPRADARTFLRGFWFNPRRYPNLGWVWLSRSMVFVALSFYSLYTVYLLASKLSLDPTAIAALIASVGGVGVLATVAGAIGGGFLSDRFHSRKVFLILGALLLGTGLLTIGTTSSIPQYIVGALLSSFGIGVYAAVDQATFLDVIPAEEDSNGRYLGIINLANQVPQAIGPFAAGLLIIIAGGDYGWVYAAAGCFAVLGALTILPLRIKRAREAATDDSTSPSTERPTTR